MGLARGLRGARRWQLSAGRWASGRAAGARDARGVWQERQVCARQADAGQARKQLAGLAGNERQARGQARRGRAGARGWAHSAREARPAWAWPGRWMGA